LLEGSVLYDKQSIFSHSLDKLLEGGLVGDLELLEQVLHKPFAIGNSVEVVVVDTFDIDARGLATNARDVLEGDIIGASVVHGGREHRNRHLLDALEGHERRLVFAVQPIVGELLEALNRAVHAPVFL